MLIIGLTGGIGSGKSAASQYFEDLGISVADADIASRTVVEPNKPALKSISKYFGREILQDDGQLNRPLLRQKIFSSPADKQWLESLLHPLIADEIQRQLDEIKSPYALLSSPLLLETGQCKNVDRILVVDVPEQTQITRSCLRDNNSEAQIKSIIAAQIPRAERLQRADDVIDNNGSKESLQSQVLELHERYKVLSRQYV